MQGSGQDSQRMSEGFIFLFICWKGRLESEKGVKVGIFSGYGKGNQHEDSSRSQPVKNRREN